jgi:hypothetical protein
MVQQSKTEPRGTEKTKGIDVDPHQKSLAEARLEQEQPAGEFEITHGDRTIKRGAHQEGDHRKRRSAH